MLVTCNKINGEVYHQLEVDENKYKIENNQLQNDREKKLNLSKIKLIAFYDSLKNNNEVKDIDLSNTIWAGSYKLTDYDNQNVTIIERKVNNGYTCISNVKFIGCKFNNSNMNVSKFNNCYFENCDFENTKFNRTIFSSCSLYRNLFENCYFNGSSISSTNENLFGLNVFDKCRIIDTFFMTTTSHNFDNSFNDCLIINTDLNFVDLEIDGVRKRRTLTTTLKINGRSLPNLELDCGKMKTYEITALISHNPDLTDFIPKYDLSFVYILVSGSNKTSLVRFNDFLEKFKHPLGKSILQLFVEEIKLLKDPTMPYEIIE